MPTVLRIRGFRFHFFANEGPRPHIHVEKGTGTAKVWLDDLSCAEWDNLTNADRRTILRLVEAHQEELLNAWRKFFKSR